MSSTNAVSFHRHALRNALTDCVANRVLLAVPQPTEWQRIGNQIDAAFIFARGNKCGFATSHPKGTHEFKPDLFIRSHNICRYTTGGPIAIS
jgi:hypothetical protein